MAIDQYGNVIPAPAWNANGPRNPTDPMAGTGYATDGRGVVNQPTPVAGNTLAQTVIDAVDVINKAMGEMSAASQGQVISPVGAATKTAHVISPGALQAADDKIRGATQRLKDAVGNYNGRPAGDPFWHNRPVAGPIPARPVVAAAPVAKPSLFASAVKTPARPSWPGR